MQQKKFVWQDIPLYGGNVLFLAGMIGLMTSLKHGLKRFVASTVAIVVGPALALRYEKSDLRSLLPWQQVLYQFLLSPDEYMSEEEVILRTEMNQRVVNDALGYLTISGYIKWAGGGNLPSLSYILEPRRARKSRRKLGRHAPR